jgi:hypothetical protein
MSRHREPWADRSTTSTRRGTMTRWDSRPGSSKARNGPRRANAWGQTEGRGACLIQGIETQYGGGQIVPISRTSVARAASTPMRTEA